MKEEACSGWCRWVFMIFYFWLIWNSMSLTGLIGAQTVTGLSELWMKAVAEREQEYNQQQQQIKHAFQCKSITAYWLHRAKKRQGTFLLVGRYTPPVACVFLVKMKNFEWRLVSQYNLSSNFAKLCYILELNWPMKLISAIQGMVDERFDSQAHLKCPFCGKH